MDDNTAEAFRPDTLLVLPGGVLLELVCIPAGRFRMGQRGGRPNEEPVHEVVIAHEFWLGATPVTQAQYRAMASVCLDELAAIAGNRDAEPSLFPDADRPDGRENRDDHPVERVSWGDARCVCRGLTRWLRDAGRLPEDWRVDLPTEAQWEYACRAGTDTIYATGDGEADLARAGWYRGNADGRTHPVKEREANRWGLFDMHGNVLEWCRDAWNEHAYAERPAGSRDPWERRSPDGDDDPDRVVRGGSWVNSAWDCRSADRGWRHPWLRNYALGFRVGLFPGPSCPGQDR
jgi:formylglycine-generating enzyme required for sulfatase activity